jgi:polyhydroxyalkanoate synthesis regulator phasin
MIPAFADRAPSVCTARTRRVKTRILYQEADRAPSRPGRRKIYTRVVRLTPDEIEFLARKIVKTLVREGKLELDSEPRIVEALIKVITDDLAVEDKLNEEVREVLTQHTSEMQRSNITYAEMFKLVKKKLAKEKGIVL